MDVFGTLFPIKHFLSASLFQPDACKLFTEGQMCWPSSWPRRSRETERKPRLPVTRGYTKPLTRQQGKHTQTHTHGAWKTSLHSSTAFSRHVGEHTHALSLHERKTSSCCRKETFCSGLDCCYGNAVQEELDFISVCVGELSIAENF